MGVDHRAGLLALDRAYGAVGDLAAGLSRGLAGLLALPRLGGHGRVFLAAATPNAQDIRGEPDRGYGILGGWPEFKTSGSTVRILRRWLGSGPRSSMVTRSRPTTRSSSSAREAKVSRTQRMIQVCLSRPGQVLPRASSSSGYRRASWANQEPILCVYDLSLCRSSLSEVSSDAPLTANLGVSWRA
jgi:hypothetical protein